MPQEQKKERKGILRVFLSSTYKDLNETRGLILDQLSQALESAAMEKFISRGERPQTTALKELIDSDIVIFLISPSYGTNIEQCEFAETCEATCEMKTGEEAKKISYAWCEYRVTTAEEKPHATYIIDEGWPSRDGAPIIWKMRDEVEKETCPRIQNDEKSVEKVVNGLVDNIVTLYSGNKINFNRFCGRRDLLKDLFNKMNKSVNVHGVGGIGKTTLCDVALLLYRLRNRKVFYVGSQEAYASGTGYEFTSEKLTPHRYKDLTIDDIADVLGLGALKVDEETKMGIILQMLEKEDAILFIDNFRRIRA